MAKGGDKVKIIKKPLENVEEKPELDTITAWQKKGEWRMGIN
jgi:hypothetical protein